MFDEDHRADAEALAQKADYGEVEEYEINAWVTIQERLRNGDKLWHVKMDRDGNSEISEAELWRWTVENISSARVWWNTKTFVMYTDVIAPSEQVAAKIANERRIKAIANGEWPRGGGKQ